MLSFATYLRNFASIPLLFVQFFSPLLAPIVLYSIPSSLVSALVVGQWTHHREMDESADIGQLESRLNWINIALALLLTLVYFGIFIRFTEMGANISSSNIGIFGALLCIPGFILGSMVGDYARSTALKTTTITKGKRKLKNDLRDEEREINTPAFSEDESSIENQSG